MENAMGRRRPDYGFDAPGVIRNLLGSGLVCLIIGLAFPAVRWFLSPAISLLASGAVMLYASKIGKLRLREQLMATLPWRGHETTLDLGCGSGLLLIAAAKRVPKGMAVGVDIWRGEDLTNTRPSATLENAALEGVLDRVRLAEGDARYLPFADGTFDAVLSLNVLHNLSKRHERETTLGEIVRVLKPGGLLLLSDFRNVREYVSVLPREGDRGRSREADRVGRLLSHGRSLRTERLNGLALSE